MKLKLVSFDICPYVHRSVITLKAKDIPFEIEYIDLKNKPEWFLKLSPMGKVPLLQINDRDVVFESAVINELIDVLVSPSTLSKDPIEKAKERAWIAYSDYIFGDFHAGLRGDSEKSFDNLVNKLAKLEDVISDSGFFKDTGFSIIDSSYAPILYRMQFIDALENHPGISKLKKVRRWKENLIYKDYVVKSVIDNFEARFKEYVKGINPVIKFQANACNI